MKLKLQLKEEQLQPELSGRTITQLDASNKSRKLLPGRWRMYCSLIGLEDSGSNKLTPAAASLKMTQPADESKTLRSYRVCVPFKINICFQSAGVIFFHSEPSTLNRSKLGSKFNLTVRVSCGRSLKQQFSIIIDVFQNEFFTWWSQANIFTDIINRVFVILNLLKVIFVSIKSDFVSAIDIFLLRTAVLHSSR